MEKFAIKIDENVRLRLYKICRLCGTDNPNSSFVLDDGINRCDGEPEFQKKVFVCIGIQVTKIDKMPQSVCDLCRDKVNDFFEFREMCVATDVQTRRLLGIPDICVPKVDPSLDIKVSELEDKSAIDKTLKKRKIPIAKKMKVEKKTDGSIKKKLKAENSIIPTLDTKIKLKAESAIPKQIKGRKRKAPSMNLLAEKPPNKRERLRETQIIRKSKLPLALAKIPTLSVDGAVSNVFCGICDKPFYNAGELHRHLDLDHLPRIVSYHCVRCSETIEDKKDIKNHNLWHKLSKTPFQCGRCDKLISSLVGYTRHSQICLLFDQSIVNKTKTCGSCNKEFVTLNLYNWHSCVLSKLKCPICQRRFLKKSSILKHVVRCSPKELPMLSPIDNSEEPFENSISNDGISIAEEINIKPDVEIEIEMPRKERGGEPSHFVVIPSGVTNSDCAALNCKETDVNVNAFLSCSIESNREPSGNLENRNLSNSFSRLTNLKKYHTTLISVKKEPVENITESESNEIAPDMTSCNEISANTISASDISPNAIDSSGVASNIFSGREIDPDMASSSQINTSIINTAIAQAAIRIKTEIINSEYEGLYDPQICSNIKKESGDVVEKSVALKPTLKLVIKKEHGTLNASFVDGDGISNNQDLSPTKKKKKKSKKIFKIPKGLAMKIKQEKMENLELGLTASGNELFDTDREDVALPIISQVCSRPDFDAELIGSSSFHSDYRGRLSSENDECGGLSSENDGHDVRVPIISSVSSGNTIPAPITVNVRNEPFSTLPAIRIKSEFSLYNFGDNENTLPKENSDNTELISNVQIKMEDNNFEAEEYRTSMCNPYQDNAENIQGERHGAMAEMEISNPVTADDMNRLNLNESDRIRDDNRNNGTEFVISRVESINGNELEPRIPRVDYEKSPAPTVLDSDHDDLIRPENQLRLSEESNDNKDGSCTFQSVQHGTETPSDITSNINDGNSTKESGQSESQSNKADSFERSLPIERPKDLFLMSSQVLSNVSKDCANSDSHVIDSSDVRESRADETSNLLKLKSHDSSCTSHDTNCISEAEKIDSQVNPVDEPQQLQSNDLISVQVDRDKLLEAGPRADLASSEGLRESEEIVSHVSARNAIDKQVERGLQYDNKDKAMLEISDDFNSDQNGSDKSLEVNSHSDNSFLGGSESGEEIDETVSHENAIDEIEKNDARESEYDNEDKTRKLSCEQKDIGNLLEANSHDDISSPDGSESVEEVVEISSQINAVDKIDKSNARESEYDNEINAMKLSYRQNDNSQLEVHPRDDFSIQDGCESAEEVEEIASHMNAVDEINEPKPQYDNEDLAPQELSNKYCSLQDLSDVPHKSQNQIAASSVGITGEDALNKRRLSEENSMFGTNQYQLEKCHSTKEDVSSPETNIDCNSCGTNNNRNITKETLDKVEKHCDGGNQVLDCHKGEILNINIKMNSFTTKRNDNLPLIEDFINKNKAYPTDSSAKSFKQNTDRIEVIKKNLDSSTLSSHDNFCQNSIQQITTSQALKEPPIKIADAVPNVNNSAPSTSHSIMFNINEIAENTNNANIEKQLQNDFDDISSNSDLDFDETSSVGSLSEISESSISISTNDKLCSN